MNVLIDATAWLEADPDIKKTSDLIDKVDPPNSDNTSKVRLWLIRRDNRHRTLRNILTKTGRRYITLTAVNPEFAASVEIRDSINKAIRDHLICNSKADHVVCISEYGIAGRPELIASRSATVQCQPVTMKSTVGRSRIAIISPLPPLKTGVAAYLADLLPELSLQYDITIVTNQPHVDPSLLKFVEISTCQEFIIHHKSYEFKIYHIGNSEFHTDAVDLIDIIPGIVVLHDFYLDGLMHSHQVTGNGTPFDFVNALRSSHGYLPWIKKIGANELTPNFKAWPANWKILESATQTIHHSDYSKKLGGKFYPNINQKTWSLIHLPRKTAKINKEKSREQLRLHNEEHITASFGFLNDHKLVDRIISAWLESETAQKPNSCLIFVGSSNMSAALEKKITAIKSKSGNSQKIRITGWTSPEEYSYWLQSIDIAIQLRVDSRGETSGALLDCLAHGIPTIINSHGTFEEVPCDSAVILPENPDVLSIRSAIDLLSTDSMLYTKLQQRSRSLIESRHSHAEYVKKLSQALMRSKNNEQKNDRTLIDAVLQNVRLPVSSYVPLARILAKNVNFSKKRHRNVLYIDVSAIKRNDLNTGIQRVVKSLIHELFKNPPDDYQIEPVYATDIGNFWHYRTASAWVMQFLQGQSALQDTLVEFGPNDHLLIADLEINLHVETARSGLLDDIRFSGTKIHSIVYDMLPIQFHQYFPPGTDKKFKQWLASMWTSSDTLIGISKSVVDDLVLAQAEKDIPEDCADVRFFHLGADFSHFQQLESIDSHAYEKPVNAAIQFLMVGTLEPRKGHRHVLEAFDVLWSEGADVTLTIVGKEGWMVDAVIKMIKNHPELDHRLIWHSSAPDSILAELYSKSDALIFASEGEGFGLPLVEAAHHGLPIIARDIPVFREVAGNHAWFFSASDAIGLAESLRDWMTAFRQNTHPNSDGMPVLTWRESTDQLLTAMGITARSHSTGSTDPA